MVRLISGAVALALTLAAVPVAQAADCGCRPAPRHHRHVTMHRAPRVVYRPVAPRVVVAPRVYNYEDNGAYDGADLPRPGVGYGQPPSWLDGYGTRPVVYGRYGAWDAYGGSAQVMPWAIPPAGGLAVYVPGAYGPGPRIIHVPPGY